MTRPRESKIEDYLCDRVKDTGGEIRKQVWPGHNGCPDRLCWWPTRVGDAKRPKPRYAFIELKRPPLRLRTMADAALAPHQSREVAKMRLANIPVWTIDTKAGVDEFIEEMTRD